MNDIMIEIKNASDIIDDLHRKGMELWDDFDDKSEISIQFCEEDKKQIFSSISKLRTKLDIIEDGVENIGRTCHKKGV